MTVEGASSKIPDLVLDSSSTASTLTSKNSYMGRDSTKGGNFQGRGRYYKCTTT